MRILLTAGPTHEPIDSVRYIGNRSSGQLGAAIAAHAVDEGHTVTVIAGPVAVAFPSVATRIDVETAREMHLAVMQQFPQHDLLIMAAAVADFRPVRTYGTKLPRKDHFSLELEPTTDILAEASAIKQPTQRTIGFSLEQAGNVARSREKLVRKKLDLIVYNPTSTMNSTDIDAIFLWPDGREERPGGVSKSDFARLLLSHEMELFTTEAQRHGGASDSK